MTKDIQIHARHLEIAAQLVEAAVDGDDIALLDGLSEIVGSGLRTAIGVIATLARDLAAAMLLLHGGPYGARAAFSAPCSMPRRPATHDRFHGAGLTEAAPHVDAGDRGCRALRQPGELGCDRFHSRTAPACWNNLLALSLVARIEV